MAAVCYFFLPGKILAANSKTGAFALQSEKQVYAQYAGSASCRECHFHVHELWLKENHGLAERPVSLKLDEAAFAPSRSFAAGLQTNSVAFTNASACITSVGLSGKPEAHRVDRVIGDNPLREFLVSAPGGRWQVMEAAYDPHRNQWFDVFGSENRRPGEWGHWTGRGMNWNSMCAACHNTALHKNYDAATDSYHTTMAEPTVSCEACHGPLKAHVEWGKKYQHQGKVDPTVPKLTPAQIMDTCASCHARRADLTGNFKPGDAFFDHYDLSMVDYSDVFYPDGQVHDEDYEFSAFLGSKMHQAGVTCLDCHPRSANAPKLQGNAMCLRCHGGGYPKAPIIRPEEHSHHLAGSAGDECVSCHMPVTTYMQRHPRHDHGLTIPDPLLTKQFDIPNACERCHADKGTDWNLKSVEEWYGTNMNLPYRWHARTVALARRGDEDSVQPLLKMLATDGNFYWRGVAANLLHPWCNEPAVKAGLLAQLKDTNALVRQRVVEALAPLSQAGSSEVTAALQPMLQDSFRNVRVEAARVLSDTMDTNSRAGSEYMHFLDNISDQPLGQMQIGVFELQRGDVTNALRHFQTAAKWDPSSAGIREELAVVLSRLGHKEDAVNELKKAVELAPREAELHYKLALALNEISDSKGTLAQLEDAVRLDPHHARAGYNLGLARNAAGDPVGAIQALLAAETADPHDPRIPYARATIYVQLGQIANARAAAHRALELDPDFTDAALLLRQLN